MPQPVLVVGSRTPMGRLLGSQAALPAPSGLAIEAALQRARVASDRLNAVSFGNALQAGAE
jgi:acetyl-CoA C-acetyltransferase